MWNFTALKYTLFTSSEMANNDWISPTRIINTIFRHSAGAVCVLTMRKESETMPLKLIYLNCRFFFYRHRTLTMTTREQLTKTSTRTCVGGEQRQQHKTKQKTASAKIARQREGKKKCIIYKTESWSRRDKVTLVVGHNCFIAVSTHIPFVCGR